MHRVLHQLQITVPFSLLLQRQFDYLQCSEEPRFLAHYANLTIFTPYAFK